MGKKNQNSRDVIWSDHLPYVVWRNFGDKGDVENAKASQTSDQQERKSFWDHSEKEIMGQVFKILSKI